MGQDEKTEETPLDYKGYVFAYTSVGLPVCHGYIGRVVATSDNGDHVWLEDAFEASSIIQSNPKGDPVRSIQAFPIEFTTLKKIRVRPVALMDLSELPPENRRNMDAARRQVERSWAELDGGGRQVALPPAGPRIVVGPNGRPLG